MPIAQFQLGHGGAEAQAHKLASTLMARGHEVEIVTTRPRGAPLVDDVEGVPVRRLFSFGGARGLWRAAPYSYTGLLMLQLVAHRRRYDVIHAHQAFHPAFAAVATRAAHRHPVIVKVATAGSYGDLVQMRRGGPSLPVRSGQMLRTILRGADAVVAISSAVAHELQEAGVPTSRVVRIPNGVELPAPATAAWRRRQRESLALRPDDRVALYVGRAGAQKGADLLVAAWRAVARRVPSAQLLLVGGGFDADRELSSAVAAMPRVRLVGQVRDVPRYLAAADVFVLPSRGEGLSNALLEAMASGTPCVVSDLPANRDLIRDGETGLLVAADDAGALAVTLQRALEEPTALLPLAAAARRLVERDHGIDTVATRYEGLYEQLIRKQRSGARDA